MQRGGSGANQPTAGDDGPVGNPVGDPPTGSYEMAKVVPGSIGAGGGRRPRPAFRGVEQPQRLRRIGADDRPQLRALARRDGHRPGHRQAPGGAVVSGDERSLDPSTMNAATIGAGAAIVTGGGATGSGRTISSPNMPAAASDEASAKGRQ